MTLRSRTLILATAALTAVALLTGPGAAASDPTDDEASRTRWVSSAYDGSPGNGVSQTGAVSADGRYAAFASLADNLVEDDTNILLDVFVRDVTTGAVSLISRIRRTGVAAGGSVPEISADGRFVVFCSTARLVARDTNGKADIYVHRVDTGKLRYVSKAVDRGLSDGNSCTPSMSADGRFIAFVSDASNLVPNDRNGFEDVFISRWRTKQSVLISHTPGGKSANRDSDDPSISGNGRYVAYHSYATNLVPNDHNGDLDVLVYDRQTDQNVRASNGPDGRAANGGSARGSISEDGQFVVYHSSARNLVHPDRNRATDVFRTSMSTGETILVTRDPDGGQVDGASLNASSSPDGHLVAFASNAPDQIRGFEIVAETIFVRDIDAGVTRLVSQYPDGSPVQLGAYDANFAGGYISFTTDDRLSDGDTNHLWDIYRYRLP